jgi:hypothetical protein
MSLTNVGRAFQAGVMGDPNSDGSGDYAPANWMGLSQDGGSINDASTVLAGEITSGTMDRGLCSFAHTPGSGFYTLSRVVVADQDVTIRKVGIFNAASGGTLVWHDLLSQARILNNGEQATFTITCALS